ncbi:IS21 family transposase [Alkalicoccus chagannorensis]
MYHDIYQLKQQGFKIRGIARKLGISRTTVYKYLAKSPEEMAVWMASTRTRIKRLDPYEMVIQTWLSEHPDLSSAQVQDWLKEKYPNLSVGEATVRNYVRDLRDKYDLPKKVEKRQYQAVEELPPGQQAQVDFGQTHQKVKRGGTQKLWFLTMVLSHSRYKYVEWLDRPFTTKDVIRSHERAFRFFEGRPQEMVYDQDALLVVNENMGDIIYTAEFQAYIQERGFQVRLCRKADPESKGKVENVVGFVKKNFARGRCFSTIEQWNEQCTKWLSRTGNGNIHHTIKKRPAEVFALEKQHLQPVTKKDLDFTNSASIARSVRKDNTIMYKGNRYSLPYGTYEQGKQIYLEVIADQQLILKGTPDGEVIAKHDISSQKGKLIQSSKHTRDRSSHIATFMETAASLFKNKKQAAVFLDEVYHRHQRYMRDQLMAITKLVQTYPEEAEEALRICVTKALFSAAEFRDVVNHLNHASKKKEMPSHSPLYKSLHDKEPEAMKATAAKAEVSDYLNILQGGDLK